MADTERAFSLLGLILELGGCPDHRIVIVADCGISDLDRTRLLNSCSTIFKSAVLVPTPHKLTDESWPKGANWLFKTACKYFKEQWGTSFLWLEPDCTPLKPGWIEAVESEYVSSKQPFMGAEVNGKHLSGIAVYPFNALDYYRDFWPKASKIAWDYAVDARKLAQLTTKIHHLWGTSELPPHFVNNRTKSSPVHHLSEQIIPPDSVLFHRDKDASLTHIVAERHRNQKRGTAIVMLGRYGDLCNILPIAKHISERSERPSIVVSDKFSGLLDGISYADRISLPFEYLKRHEAIRHVRADFHQVLEAQVCGTGYSQKHACPSFTMEQWRHCGFLDKFQDRSLKLFFDVRSAERESALCKIHIQKGCPNLLFSLSSGHSSPYLEGPVLAVGLCSALKGWNCVDLDGIHAERPYDLLGLYDKANVLVTTDTMHLHLAAASNISVISLVGNNAWLASIARSKVIYRVTYAEAMASFDQILDFVESCESSTA